MFWDTLKDFGENVVVKDTGINRSFTYNDILELGGNIANTIKSGKKKLVFHFCSNNYKNIAAYIGVLRSGHTQLLIDNKINSELRNELIKIYKPEIIISDYKEEFENYEIINRDNKIFIYKDLNETDLIIHNDLGLLLSTSGTTGSPKLVRLSYKNLQSNAESISQYLNITDGEKPITNMPMSYSYGLSVINSHLLKGAEIVLTNQSIVLRDFWNIFNNNNCTSFAGVPYSFQLLKRLNFNKLNLPSLKTVTQAGGRLSEEDIIYYKNQAEEKHFKFYVMYGQTEATARISYLPFEMLNEKIGSVGIPIPNGTVKILNENEEIKTANIEGEVVYYGDNVMMGYSESRECLRKGDELYGELHTNDIGYKDEDGFLYVTGRKKRFIKIYGLRINLDEIEKMVENYFKCPAACFGNDDFLKILLQTDQNEIERKVSQKIIQMYKLHPSVFNVKKTNRILTTLQGKKDYKRMGETDIEAI